MTEANVLGVVKDEERLNKLILILEKMQEDLRNQVTQIASLRPQIEEIRRDIHSIAEKQKDHEERIASLENIRRDAAAYGRLLSWIYGAIGGSGILALLQYLFNRGS